MRPRYWAGGNAPPRSPKACPRWHRSWFPPQQLQQLGEVRRHAAGLVADLTDGLEARQSQRELPGANERRGLGDSGEIGSALVLFVDQHHVDLNFGDIHR